MFGFGKKKKPPASSDPAPAPGVPLETWRDLLYADGPLETWTANGTGTPWAEFTAAVEAIRRGDEETAVSLIRKVLDSPDLESRQYLVAWNAWRRLGQAVPTDRAQQVLGTVIELPMDQGIDLLAAWADGRARYVNHSGGAVVWETDDPAIDDLIRRLLVESQKVASAIGPWEGPRPGVPGPGQIRLSFLCPVGLLFGQGPFAALAGDPMGGPVIDAATELMRALVERTLAARRKEE